MNIFFLSRDPIDAARFLHDKHVVKMVLETAQILCTVYHRYGQPTPYQPTHTDHPSVLWVGNNIDHFRWVGILGQELCREYTHRYGKHHACEAIVAQVATVPRGLKKNGRWADPPQCMPDEYKQEDTVAAYRSYYLGRKVEQSKWTRRPVPPFVQEFLMAKHKNVKEPVVAEEAQVEAPTTETEATPGVPASRGPKGVPESAVITLKVSQNPKRVGSKARARFDFYRDGMTVKDALDAGILTADLVYDTQHGFVTIEGYNPKLVEPKPKREPKPKKAAKGKTDTETAQDEIKGDVVEEETVS